MKIALLSYSDIDAFRSLRIEAVNLAPDSFAESAEEVQTKAVNDFAQMLESHGRGDFVLGAKDGETLVGMVGFYRETHTRLAHKGHIWGMYVTPVHRQRHLGQALLSKAIERVRVHSNVHQINLHVVSTNEHAKRLYESVGFVVYGNEPKTINVNGHYLDELLMRLEIIRDP